MLSRTSVGSFFILPRSPPCNKTAYGDFRVRGLRTLSLFAAVAKSADAPELESGGGPIEPRPRAGANPVRRIF
jgi:hypothetical protein